MSPEARIVLDKVLLELVKLNIIAKAVTGNPITHEMAAIVPGMAQIVADIEGVEELVDIITTTAPTIEALIDTFHNMGVRPADGDELARLSADRERQD